VGKVSFELHEVFVISFLSHSATRKSTLAVSGTVVKPHSCMTIKKPAALTTPPRTSTRWDFPSLTHTPHTTLTLTNVAVLLLHFTALHTILYNNTLVTFKKEIQLSAFDKQ